MALGTCAQCDAAILWDYSPGVYGTSSADYTNYAGTQNFAERIVFAHNVQVKGMDIYDSPRFGNNVPQVEVRVWSDANGVPGTVLQDTMTLVSAVDNEGADQKTVRRHADFDAMALQGGTVYWIGMTTPLEHGTSLTQGGLATIPNGGDGMMAQFDGANFIHLTAAGDMAFRLEGDVVVPEPSTIGLALCGAAVGLVLFRREITKTLKKGESVYLGH
jgi:hypothetical protein